MTRDIHFKCPACRHRLAVDAVAAGRLAPCPECGEQVMIPNRSRCLSSEALKRCQIGVLSIAMLSVGILGTLGVVILWEHTTDRAEDGVPTAALSEPSVAAVSEPLEPSSESGAKVEQAPRMEENASVAVESDEEPSDIQQRYNALIAWILENIRGRYPVPERLVDAMRVNPVNEDFTLSEDLAEMLKVTPEERAYMDDVFLYARDTILALENDLMSVTEYTPLKVALSIPTYHVAGGSLKEDVFMALETTLGSHRFDRLVDVASEEMAEKFHYFGSGERSLTFEVITGNEASGIPDYLLIKDGWVVSEEEGIRKTMITETAVMELPDSYQPYADLLPSGYYGTPIP